MQKQQQKGIVLRSQFKRERVAHYPFHLVTSTYSDQDYSFLLCIDYNHDDTLIMIYPFDRQMNKLPFSSITIENILTKKAVCLLHILSLKYRETSNGVAIVQGEFVLGYRSGHLAVIETREKGSKLVTKLNKSLKQEGFFSRTSNYLFGDDQGYSVHLKEPIKGFKITPFPHDFQFCYQLGNNLLFLKNLSENSEKAIFQAQQANNAEAYAFHRDINTVAEKGPLKMYGSQEYYSIRDSKTGFVRFNYEVSSFEILSEKRKQVAVSLSVRETVLLIDMNKFELKARIKTEMSLRRLNAFNLKNQQFLALLFYDNYIVLYNLCSGKYCKLIGHRSFVANVIYSFHHEMIVTAGMDHRISLVKLSGIKEEKWQKGHVSQQGKMTELQESEAVGLRFPDIFSLGQYNNVRTNTHSYGFSDIFTLNRHFVLPTYDAKIMIYNYA